MSYCHEKLLADARVWKRRRRTSPWTAQRRLGRGRQPGLHRSRPLLRARTARSRSRPSSAMIPDPGDGLLVDLCCGEGLLSRALLERFPRARVLAMDLSPAMLEHARDGPGGPWRPLRNPAVRPRGRLLAELRRAGPRLRQLARRPSPRRPGQARAVPGPRRRARPGGRRGDRRPRPARDLRRPRRWPPGPGTKPCAGARSSWRDTSARYEKFSRRALEPLRRSRAGPDRSAFAAPRSAPLARGGGARPAWTSTG